MFSHHPDGLIYVNDTAIPLSLWRRWYPDYALPEGFVQRLYQPGIRHFLFTPNGSAEPQPLQDDVLDRFIQNEQVYVRRLKRLQHLNTQSNPLDGKVRSLWQ